LIEIAARAFDALHYTGLGNLEFIQDSRDGRYKFLEINPRLWANVGFAQHAGVDLYTPYHAIVQGRIPEADLRYRTGLIYRRWLRDLRLMARKPGRIFGFAGDCLNVKVHSDFAWSDPSATFPFAHFVKWLARERNPQVAGMFGDRRGIHNQGRVPKSEFQAPESDGGVGI
jgi:hypothetical protein